MRSSPPVRSRLTRTLRVAGRRRTALLASAALVTTAVIPLSASGSAQAGPAATAAASAAERRGERRNDVMANLFEWNWASVAEECETVLGPNGFGGVQVAPPHDSLKRTALGDGSDTVLHPWWEVYQPVSYTLFSRMGGEAQFKEMVDRCRGAGVKVYVDAVINHMTGQGNISYGGVRYEHFEYPGLYSGADDFHQRGTNCTTSSTGGIEDFNNLLQVTKCELLGLADLRTGSEEVRTKVADYLNTLISYGVSGFRVDAAKHIAREDLAAIRSKLNRTADGTRPFFAVEVFGGGPGVLAPHAYQSVGTPLGLDGVKQLRDAFKSYPAEHIGSIATLKIFGEGSGLTSSGNTLSFVQNHDTERNGDALSYKDGARNVLAHYYLLGYGYGRPQVYSSFTWDATDSSPPSDADGFITDTDCSSDAWECVHRTPGILGMVGWHNRVGKAPVANWWDDGENLIAFSRGDRGWITINNGAAAKTQTFTTGLPRGTYCDVIHGRLSAGACSGPTVSVDGRGRATVQVPAKDAVAFTGRDLVRR